MTWNPTWKLMVLEDDTQLREVLTTVLEDEGYQVAAVSNGREAVERAALEPFDLIITDIRMDGLNGLDALEQARRLQPGLGSLVVSGYTTEAETLRALQLNVGGFLKKPFSLGDLLSRVRDLLAQRQAALQQRDERGRLRQSLWWVLERALGRSGGPAAGEVREAGALAFHLSLQVGAPPEEAYASRLAAMLACSGWEELPPFAQADAIGLGPIASILQLAHGGQPGLAGQVVQSALRLARGEPSEEVRDPRLEAVLRAHEPLHLEAPHVQASLAVQEQMLGLVRSTRLHRALLALGQTLEERGDWSAAEDAFRRLREDPDSSPEARAQALIGMARARFSQDQEFYDLLKEAEVETRTLGPVAGASRRWPIAALLLRSGHPSGERYLQNLESDFEQLGLRLAWARARVARAWLRPSNERLAEALLELASPAALGEIAPESTWLAPALLALGPGAGLEPGPWACRVAREFPAPVARWCLSQRLDSPGLQLLLRALESDPQLATAGFLLELAAHSDPAVQTRLAALRSALDGAESSASMRVRSLGSLEVFVNGRIAPDSMWKTPKYKLVLAYLVARPGQTVPEDVLMEEFWAGSASAKASVYSATTTIRRCLREGGGETAGNCLRRDADGLAFDPPPSFWHDLAELEKASAAFAAGDLEAGRQAAGLLGGPYLQGCYLDWALRKRAAIDEQAVRLFAGLGGALRETRPQEALDYAQRGLELDPLSQECHLVRMQAFLKLGQPEKALRQFNSCQQVLRKELDIEPLTSLYEVYYRAQLAQP